MPGTTTSYHQNAIDGFWLPSNIRNEMTNSDTRYIYSTFTQGKPCESNVPGAITARWPAVDQAFLAGIVKKLQAGSKTSPIGQEYWNRLEKALKELSKRISDPGDPLQKQILGAVPPYTGFSKPMIAIMLRALNMMSLDQMPKAYRYSKKCLPARDWESIDSLPGQLLFTHTSRVGGLMAKILGSGRSLTLRAITPPEFILGYGAGNVPGTALLIALLGQSVTLTGCTPPTVLVRNSRREPIFTPLILQGIEAIDAELVAGIGVIIWDYQDSELQDSLLAQSDLVIAAAGDDTITEINRQITSTNKKRGTRTKIKFHQHGHKVSFSAISHDVLQKDLTDPEIQQSVIEVVAVLAGLDSIYWDQYGCLSSRIHFIEQQDGNYHTVQDYAERLVTHLRSISALLPRGCTPLRNLRDTFDRYKTLESGGQVKVISAYNDEFLVVVDSRSLDPLSFYAVVNSCMGRVIIVRGVSDLLDVPRKFLSMLPEQNLQSLSIGLGPQGDDGLDDRFLEFAGECAREGVTAIRSLGRGAFPQLVYSWDGLIPLDLVASRPEGWFSTIEFDDPYQEIIATYRRFLSMDNNG